MYCHPITQLLTQLLTFSFLLNKKSQNHVNGLGFRFVFYLKKKIKKIKEKKSIVVSIVMSLGGKI
jgi:hypothetical protein